MTIPLSGNDRRTAPMGCGRVYQRIGRPYEASLASPLTRVIPSIWDWEINIRSNGSLW